MVELQFDIPREQLFMKARGPTTDILFGLVPIALLLAVMAGLVSFGYAPTTLLPPPGLVFQRLVQELTTITFQQEIASTLFRLFAGFYHCGGAWRRPGSCGGCQSRDQCRAASDRARAGAIAHRSHSARHCYCCSASIMDRRSAWSPTRLFPILLSTYYGASMVGRN